MGALLTICPDGPRSHTPGELLGPAKEELERQAWGANRESDPPPSRFWSTTIGVQVLNGIGVRLGVARQEGANEPAEILVRPALCLGRDAIEDNRRFAGTQGAGEDRDLSFGDA
jgi:hypothetical protein